MENYLQTREGQALPVTHCIKDTPGWEIAPAVRGALGEKAVCLTKPTFGSRELAETLARMEEPLEGIEAVGPGKSRGGGPVHRHLCDL